MIVTMKQTTCVPHIVTVGLDRYLVLVNYHVVAPKALGCILNINEVKNIGQ